MDVLPLTNLYLQSTVRNPTLFIDRNGDAMYRHHTTSDGVCNCCANCVENNKITTTVKYIANCFTKQFTNTVKPATHKTNNLLTEKHKTYKDTTSHSLLLRSKML